MQKPSIFAAGATAVALVAIALTVGGCNPSATTTERRLKPGEIDPAFIALAGAEPPSLSTASFLDKFRKKPATVAAVVESLHAHNKYTSWFETIRFGKTESVERYALLRSGKVLVGRHDAVELPAKPTWRENPLGDRNWRSLYHCLRWLLPAIWVGQDTGDAEALRFAEGYVLDYLRKNPPSGWLYPWGDQRTAERAKVMVTLLEALRRQKLLTDDSARLLAGSLWEYGNLLASRRFYSFATNHGLFQNEALLDIALAMPEFKESYTWRNLALARMDDQLVRNVSVGGVHTEGATGYHAFTLSHFENYVRYATSHGMPISRTMASRLLGMVNFQLAICRPDGTYPMIGDTERVKAPFAKMRSLLTRLGSVGAFGSDVTMTLRARRCGQMLRFIESQGVKGTRPAGSAAFAKEGYFVLRPAARAGAGPATELFFNAAQFSGVHGHYDALSLCYSAGGKDFLVDSGKFTYAADRRREYFRSTAAHSTILVNDQNQDKASPKVIDVQLSGSFDYVEAEHFGYAGIRCNRAILHLANGWTVVVDEVQANDPMSCAVLWHLHPEAKLKHETDRTIAVMGDQRLHIVPLPGGGRRDVARGQRTPMAGWVSFKYGEITPRSVLRFSGSGKRVAFVTVLVPTTAGKGKVTASLIEATFGEQYAVRIRHDGREASVRIDRRRVPRRITVD